MPWIYKCNSQKRKYQPAWGDWKVFFASGKPQQWGSTRWRIRGLEQAKPGHTIIAYQTDRNELVGLARVIRWRLRKGARDLILQPLKTIGVKVRPLKKRYPNIARIKALQPGEVKTLYPISTRDARRLLRAAGREFTVDADAVQREAEAVSRGAGFGRPEENRRVERAAVKVVTKYLTSKGWRVRDVSSENRHYDLECRKKRDQLHVEVKGSRGAKQHFPITQGEKATWLRDPLFSLAFVGKALTRSAAPEFFAGSRGANEFVFRPISYLATRRP
jgi:hypothetical protein